MNDVIQDQAVIDCAVVADAVADVAIDRVDLYCFVVQRIYLKGLNIVFVREEEKIWIIIFN